MLDIDFIRKNPDLVKKAVAEKQLNLDVDQLVKVDEQRRELIYKVDELRQMRNEAAKKRDVEKGKKVKQELNNLEEDLRVVEEDFKKLMLLVPNIPAADSPVGPNSDSNVEILKWGKVADFDFKVKDHIELGKRLDILDLEQGARVSGFRGYYLKNEGAHLHWAILQHSLTKITQAGFKLMVPPTLVHEGALIGSGHFPFGKENVYQIANPGRLQSGGEMRNSLYLTGTSEPSLLAYYMDKVIDEKELPIKICALTHCYRSEVGDYGKDTKGVYRVHEFDKVEQVVICKNDLQESEMWFEQMRLFSESILQELGIAYRVINTSTGDMGPGKLHMHDIEAWMPGRGEYGETCSNSNLTDWQMRRTNTKVKGKDGKVYYPYALNSTVIPSPRILIAILENFQQKDGSVKIPEVLIPYTGFSEIKPK